MPIEGATFEAAMREYQKHLNALLTRTVTQARLVVAAYPSPPAGPPRMQIAFRRHGAAVLAPLRTRFGQVGLYLGQLCEDVSTPEGRHHILTVAYQYTLTPSGTDEALLRWEYVKRPERGAQWCRHHLPGPVRLTVGRRATRLNDWHLPTGHVAIEELLRFCIVDLGVKPQSVGWDAVLREL